MYLWVLDPTAISGIVQTVALFVPHTCAPFFQERAWITEIWWLFSFCPVLNLMSEVIYGPPWWQTGPDGCLNKLTRLLIFYVFFPQSLLHFENSDMGWGAAHTQECRWVETGSDTHAREVSFHPLAVVRWGGSTPNQRGGNLTPSQTATCTAFQLIQPQNFTLVL